MSAEDPLSGGGRIKAKNLFTGKQKLDLPSSPAAAFGNFIDQGNVFNIRDKTRKIDRFIPNSPDAGLQKSFNANEFVPNSTKSGKRIARLFDL